ncbi:hypothetical protein [Streptomyces sp. NBC_00385]|uniref:hypothetical protein n=1 Tax=Streptomyces sp. NBC_00385 TaxID=2975733 RepID=UPI002DDC1FE0|nr:hypothetical protein [Streptomyces sp. NBC_00385]WRZ06793.1 hypothetical protein OG959_27400 [Streptomyces sp. NBC_00385]
MSLEVAVGDSLSPQAWSGLGSVLGLVRALLEAGAGAGAGAETGSGSLLKITVARMPASGMAIPPTHHAHRGGSVRGG